MPEKERWISLGDLLKADADGWKETRGRDERLASLPPDAADVGDGRAAGRSARWKQEEGEDDGNR